MSITAGGGNRSLESVAHPRSASSAVPRLPPLSRATSLATGMSQMFDPREEKLNEMERMLTTYQEKLETVTSNYEEKVSLLENRLVEKEIEGSSNNNNEGKFAPASNQFTKLPTFVITLIFLRQTSLTRPWRHMTGLILHLHASPNNT